MTIPIHRSEFVGAYEPLEVTVALWRGAMLDRFAKAENIIFLTIRALHSTGAKLSSDAYSEGAKARLRALLEYLDGSDLAGIAKAPRKLLQRLLELNDHRTALAHGVLRMVGGAIELEWARPGKSRSITFHRRRISMCELVMELSALDRLQRDLASQLGQVRKAVRDRAKSP